MVLIKSQIYETMSIKRHRFCLKLVRWCSKQYNVVAELVEATIFISELAIMQFRLPSCVL